MPAITSKPVTPLDLANFDVDPVRGFLPAEDPLQRLPKPFAEWDLLAAELPYLLLTGQVRRRLSRIGPAPLERLTTAGELERAMLILSSLGMAYVWGTAEPAERLPPSLALPWAAVAKRLGRPPIITHATAVLNNWRRVDPLGPLTVDNLACTQHFLGGMDEQWFFTATAGVELAGAPALPLLIDAQQAAAKENDLAVRETLNSVAAIFERVNVALQRIYERCDPHIFYHRIRPFLAGWNQHGLLYEGVSDTPLKLHGGSAAQSSLIQAFDAALGIEHLHPETRPFLMLMRDYMPPPHRRFIEALANQISLYEFVQNRPDPLLKKAFNRCITLLDRFRQAHMEIAVRYILHQSGDEDGVGTGGTSFVPFLSEARRETRDRKL